MIRSSELETVLRVFRRKNASQPGGGLCPPDDLLAGYLDGDLVPEVNLAIERHAVGCSACSRAMLQLREARDEALAEMRSGQPSPGFGERLAARLRARTVGWSLGGLATASAVAVLVLAVILPGLPPSGSDLPAWSPPVRTTTTEDAPSPGVSRGPSRGTRDIEIAPPPVEAVPREAPGPVPTIWPGVRPLGVVSNLRALVWPTISGADRYSVSVFDASGALVWAETGIDRNWVRPPRSTRTQIEPGRTYFWEVEAYSGATPLARSARTGFVLE